MFFLLLNWLGKDVSYLRLWLRQSNFLIVVFVSKPKNTESESQIHKEKKCLCKAPPSETNRWSVTSRSSPNMSF